ncbi:MAG: hypothetical protein JW778_07350 [Candidatus Altiarchaeota archaeon]|nr:hypothetical protein [Candidatus Altiarchaeota archaeon]
MNKKILIVGVLVIVLLTGCLHRFRSKSTTTTVVTTTTTAVTTTTMIPPKTELSQVKVASLYERVTDYVAVGWSVDEVTAQLRETRTDFIFRGFWKWAPCPDSGAKDGYSYQDLKTTITEIKKEKPEVIFCGAIPAQRLTEGEMNPKTGRPFTREELNSMAFNPSKWDLPVSPEEIEQFMEIQRFEGYYPDLTNEDVQELFLDWAKKQIDCGADAIWIDGFFGPPSILVRAGRIEPNHPFVGEWMESASRLVDRIHEYGYSKYQKRIYVGSWVTFTEFSHAAPDLDFATATPSGKEIERRVLDREKWDDLIVKVREKMGGDFPVFVFLDWSSKDDTPLAVFSQRLSTSEQNEVLEEMDGFFEESGMIFVYPVHGGFMGSGAKKLTYGRYGTYNSLYFGNYETIKGLALNKSRSE